MVLIVSALQSRARQLVNEQRGQGPSREDRPMVQDQGERTGPGSRAKRRGQTQGPGEVMREGGQTAGSEEVEAEDREVGERQAKDVLGQDDIRRVEDLQAQRTADEQVSKSIFLTSTPLITTTLRLCGYDGQWLLCVCMLSWHMQWTHGTCQPWTINALFRYKSIHVCCSTDFTTQTQGLI